MENQFEDLRSELEEACQVGVLHVGSVTDRTATTTS